MSLRPLIVAGDPAACVVAAGARSIGLGKDVNWDLRNYHWYNAWALLNGRLGWDLAPAQLQTYYNPRRRPALLLPGAVAAVAAA